MGYNIVGKCPHCGAPVYAESSWWGIIPPPSHPSCGCNFGQYYAKENTNTNCFESMRTAYAGILESIQEIEKILEQKNEKNTKLDNEK